MNKDFKKCHDSILKEIDSMPIKGKTSVTHELCVSLDAVEKIINKNFGDLDD